MKPSMMSWGPEGYTPTKMTPSIRRIADTFEHVMRAQALWKCHHCSCPIWTTSHSIANLPPEAITGALYHHGFVHCWPCLKLHHWRGYRIRITERAKNRLQIF